MSRRGGQDQLFKTKHDIALDMIEQAARDQIPGTIVLADSFYGHSRPFREAVSLLGFDYGRREWWLAQRRWRS